MIITLFRRIFTPPLPPLQNLAFFAPANCANLSQGQAVAKNEPTEGSVPRRGIFFLLKKH